MSSSILSAGAKARPAPTRASGRGGRRCSSTVSATAAAAPASVTRPKLRKLGDSDLIVNKICLGTMTWGEQNTEAEAHEQLSYACIDRDINFIDTAEMYPVPTKPETQGRTESYIGTWLKKAHVPRDKLVLASKVCGYGEGRITWVRDNKAGSRVNRAQILEACDKSLKRLQTDHLDLLQIHWPDRYVPLFGAPAYDLKLERESVPFEEQLEAFRTLVEAGKVRYMGVSNETSFGVMKFAQLAESKGLPKVVSIQNVYSLINRSAFETDLAEVVRKATPSKNVPPPSPLPLPPHRNCNVGLLAYSPLSGGALSGKYVDGNAPKGARFTLFQGYMARYNKSLPQEATKEYIAVAEKHGLTPVELALGFVKARWFVASTIIGATSLKQLKEDIDAFQVNLSNEVMADINTVYKRYRDPVF